MKRTAHEVLTDKHSILGFKIADLLGIVIMVIPCIICIREFETAERYVSFIPFWTHPVKKNINPNLITSLCAAGFYCSLIVRYGFFRKETLFEAIISSIRAFLNIWVLAALISVVLSTANDKVATVSVFKYNTCTLFLLAVILSWLGMRTIAGYSWIIFFLAGINHIEQINKAMGMHGAVFIITTAISLVLQVNNYANIKDFASDFYSRAKKYAPTIKDDVNIAVQDASDRVQAASEIIKETVPIPKSFNRVPATRASGASLDLDTVKSMLDVNGDGVFDEKDISIINEAKNSHTS